MKYQVIYADPPWKYGMWGKASNRGLRKDTFRPDLNVPKPLPYLTMTISEIKNLPIQNIADNNCELYLWTTQRYLPISFEVIKEWGFKYCQTLTWCKTPRGTGQGGLYCPTTEFLILARKGKMPIKRRLSTTWWNIKRPHNSHSTKPDFFRDLISKMSNGKKIELFARKKTEGWDVWGNEVKSDIEL